eukprot:scaffold62869_cov67-Phaeocystis_antarctica.AAC.1
MRKPTTAQTPCDLADLSTFLVNLAFITRHADIGTFRLKARYSRSLSPSRPPNNTSAVPLVHGVYGGVDLRQVEVEY